MSLKSYKIFEKNVVMPFSIGLGIWMFACHISSSYRNLLQGIEDVSQLVNEKVLRKSLEKNVFMPFSFELRTFAHYSSFKYRNLKSIEDAIELHERKNMLDS